MSAVKKKVELTNPLFGEQEVITEVGGKKVLEKCCGNCTKWNKGSKKNRFGECKKHNKMVEFKAVEDCYENIREDISDIFKYQYANAINIIKDLTRQNTLSYFYIGYQLAEMKEKGWCQGAGHKDIYECGLKEFGWKKSYISRFLKVFDRFAVKDDRGYRIREIQAVYADYDFTKLIELLKLSDEQIKEGEITFKWSFRQIRKYVKELREKMGKVAAPQLLIENYIEETPDFKKVGETFERDVKDVDALCSPAMLNYIERKLKNGYRIKIVLEKVGE